MADQPNSEERSVSPKFFGSFIHDTSFLGNIGGTVDLLLIYFRDGLTDDQLSILRGIGDQLTAVQKTRDEIGAELTGIDNLPVSALVQRVDMVTAPLIPISEDAKFLLEGQNLSEQQRELLEIIPRTIRMTLDYKGEIVLYSDILDGKAEPRIEVVNIFDAVDEALDFMGAKTGDGKITIKDRHCQSIKQLVYKSEPYIGREKVDPVMVSADRVMTRKIVHNLLSNAGKYSYWTDDVALDTNQSEGTVLFSVENCCEEVIPPELHERVFEPSYRLPGTEAQGTGMGLYFVRRMVELQGGRIYVESGRRDRTSLNLKWEKIVEKGQGHPYARFSFMLPAGSKPNI
ncbi:MAG: HAMP domain-containing histidine kinase [Candidatus Aenigmarchaeota archaeon]|nr:HAMP domain-containing histidine kinase [Candidatus Aenigmarchaeota archaeon]